MKKLIGPYGNSINFSQLRENAGEIPEFWQQQGWHPEQIIYFGDNHTYEISIPSDYVGKIIISLFPVITDDIHYHAWPNTTYTLNVYSFLKFAWSYYNEYPSLLSSSPILFKWNTNAYSFALDSEVMFPDNYLTEAYSFSLYATISSDGEGINPGTGMGGDYETMDEQLMFSASAYLVNFEDSQNRVDVGTTLGQPPLSENDLASRILQDANNLIKTTEYGEVETSGLSVEDITQAIMSQKITNSNYSVDDSLKILLAWSTGNWRNKYGSVGVYEILDPENPESVIMEITPSQRSPYKTVNLKY